MEKITDIDTIAEDAYNAGFECRESNCMPARYADVGDNWRIWCDEYQSGERDANDNEMSNRDMHPDPTGQDEPVDYDYGYHDQWEF